MGNGRLHVAVYSVNSYGDGQNGPSKHSIIKNKQTDILIKTPFCKKMLSKTDKSQLHRKLEDIYFASEINNLNLTSLWIEMHAMIDADDLIVIWVNGL